MNAFYEAFAHTEKKPEVVPSPLVECTAIVQPASLQIREKWQLGREGYDHVSAGLEYSRGGQSEMDPDPEGQSRGT